MSVIGLTRGIQGLTLYQYTFDKYYYTVVMKLIALIFFDGYQSTYYNIIKNIIQKYYNNIIKIITISCGKIIFLATPWNNVTNFFYTI